jgi:hypothetical protein
VRSIKNDPNKNIATREVCAAACTDAAPRRASAAAPGATDCVNALCSS